MSVTPSSKPAAGTQAAAFDMLMNAIGSGGVLSPVIQQLLNSDPGLVHLKGWHGLTPLHRACLAGDYHVILMLVESNSDVNAATDFNETPLHYASKRGFPAVVHLLIQCGARVDAKDNRGRNCMHHAAENGSMEVMKYFEEKFSIDLKELDNDLRSPMHIVCMHGHLDLFAFLMKNRRSDLRQADCEGNLPIHISSEKGFAYMTWCMLCVLGVGVLRLPNKAGYTPVDLVFQNDKMGHRELAPILTYYSSKPDSYPVRGPVFKWYTSLLFPLLLYAVLIIISLGITSYQFLLFLIPLALFLRNGGIMNHRLEDISRWPNPLLAGLYGAGILHTAACYFSVIYPYLYTSWWITILSWTACPSLFIVYYKLVRQDPGEVTTSARDPNTGKPLTLVDLCMMHNPEYIYCSACDLVTTKVTKHCRLCDRCFLLMDHHCLFLLKCVAKNNHALFLWLLILSCINMLFYSLGFYFYIRILYPHEAYSNLLWILIHQHAWPFSLLCLNLVTIVWVSSLICQQYMVISRGCTSYFCEWKAIQHPLTVYQGMCNFLHFLVGQPLPYVNPHSPFENSETAVSTDITALPGRIGISSSLDVSINVI